MESEEQTIRLVAELAVFFGMYRGVANKDEPRSAAVRAEYRQKLANQLARIRALGIEDPEVDYIEMRMKTRYREFPRS